MTSRFGKTYSRKGSNGSSKFDEVFNKRATLCTKWGETTYKAQVSQKRPNLKAENSEIPKKSKVEDGVSDDPFGFDSDEDSAPLPTRSVPPSKSSSPQPAESMKTAPLENFPLILEASTTASRLAGGDKICSSKSIPFARASRETKEENADQALEDGDLFSSRVSTAERSRRKNVEKEKVKLIEKTQKDPQNKKEEKIAQWKKATEDRERRKAGNCCGQSNHQSPCPRNNEMPQNQTPENNENSCATYRNVAENDTKASCQTTNLMKHNIENNSLLMWESEYPQETLTRRGLQQTSEYGLGFHIEENRSDDSSLNFYNEPHDEEKSNKMEAFDVEVLDSLKETETEAEYTAHVILRSGNCRTYCRSNKTKQSQGTFNFEKVLDGTGLSSTKSNSVLNHGPEVESKHASCTDTRVRGSAGRTRDYTVLHPSCLSVCNVTIQDSMERSADDLATAAPADLGEAGRLRKKAELATCKTTTRFRPGNPKSKKDVKLAFFGFDENDGGESGEGVSRTSGSSNYRIKYFGFDDLSESDDDDEVSSERKAKKMAKKAASARMRMSGSETNEHSLHSQAITNTDTLNYAEEPYLPDVSKKNLSKQPAKEGARKIFSGPKRSPTKAVYNARHWNHPDQEELPAAPVSRSQTVPSSASTKDVASIKDDGIFKAPAPPPKVIKAVTVPTQPNQEAITTLRCRKEDKELYTVVQHVKHFNDVVEFGENQEFSDDIEYLLSGLKSSQPLNTRCLSVISLATKCAMPSFRMHLRAHGMVAMVFKTLGDAQQYQNLALCTAALMYILSRDRLNMDLDRASLDLMIRLLEMEQDPSAHQQLSEKEMNKVKEKIRKLCETVHNRHLDLENITTGHLAMETLLSLTSKRAGDWFKEELRLLGGLDHIVDKVKECAEHLDIQDEEEKLFAYLWGAERCLRVLESVTVHNPENQSYLIAYKDSQLIVSSARALQHCEELIQHYNRVDAECSRSYSHVGKAVEDCMRAIFGVLLNLTNDNEWGSTKTGEQDSLISTVLNCVLQVPQYIPQEQRFDIRVLGLGLLINLVEYSARNRHCLVNMDTSWSFDSFCVNNEDDSLRIDEPVSAIRALVQLFLQRERAAQLAESQTDDFIKDAPSPQQDKSGEWQETSGEIQWVAAEKSNDNTHIRNMDTTNDDRKEEDDEELDLNKALQHAGKHMEDCIVASYTALLLGCLCQDSPMNVTIVRDSLPDGDFSIMTEMLKKFLSFMNLTCAVGTTGQKSISRVIDYLEHC